jgi:hypothetical protein
MILETSDSKGKLEKVFSREKVNQSCKIQVKTVEKTKRKLSKLIVVIQAPRFKRERERKLLLIIEEQSQERRFDVDEVHYYF